MPLTVCINTQNAAATLAAALKSVKGIADEIIVVDMNSEDETVAIAKKHGAKVFHYKKNWGYADPARNFALSKATQPWILVLDADEEVPPALAERITMLTSETTATPAPADADPVVCYLLARHNLVLGHWLNYTGWWPDYQVRLFRKGTVSWEVGVHRMPDITGRAVELPATPELALRHANYLTVSSYLQRLDRYTSLTAQEQVAEAAKTVGQQTAMSVFSTEFLRRFFGREGWRDGHIGLSMSLLQATYELSTFLKVAESQKWQGFDQPPEKLIGQLAAFRTELNYWLADWQVRHTSGWRKWWWMLRRKVSR